MYQYEEFYLSKYFSITEGEYLEKAKNKNETPIQASERKAIRFMEANCNVKFGYSEEVHHFEKLNKPIKYLPSAYGNGLLYPLLKEIDGFDSKVLGALTTTFVESRKESGFFNYFMNVDDISRELFPEDIDDTSLFLMGLYSAGEVTYEDCYKTGRKILQLYQQKEFLGPNGELGTWLPKEPGCKQNHIILRKLLYPPRIDVGSTINFLLFVTLFKLDNDDCLNGAIEYIEKYVDAQDKCYNDDNFPGLSYYTNHHIIYYLLSRYVEANDKAKRLCGAKFSNIVTNCLTIFAAQDSPHALDLACIILAAFNLKLHDQTGELVNGNVKATHQTNGGYKSIEQCNNANSSTGSQLLTGLVKKLMSFQSADGSFPPWNAFRWDKQGHYGGSKALTTGFCVAAISKARKLKLL